LDRDIRLDLADPAGLGENPDSQVLEHLSLLGKRQVALPGALAEPFDATLEGGPGLG
jgi:hypothetical protein